MVGVRLAMATDVPVLAAQAGAVATTETAGAVQRVVRMTVRREVRGVVIDIGAPSHVAAGDEGGFRKIVRTTNDRAAPTGRSRGRRVGEQQVTRGLRRPASCPRS
ncbi:hypothetical protein GCM10027215_06370 [Nocardioides zeae]